MSSRQLSRSAGAGRVAARVRLVHLGLGSFFRAHQAWYTDRAPDGGTWGIAAFTGRSRGLTDILSAQEGLYTLVTRAADGDRFDVIESISSVHAADDHAAWLRHLASPDLGAVTITITEFGYLRRADGALDGDHPHIRADVETLRRDPSALVRTAPARLLAGIDARRRADAGPLALVPCDNLPDNGAVVGRVLRDLAEQVDPDLAAWVDECASAVTTVVDRITPRPTADDVRLVTSATPWSDRAPIVTEPFSEWVLSGAFPGGRPRWEDAGATFTDDIAPFEQRKLWLLNGAHSLLAYAGSARGHVTVAEALADDTILHWLEEWWDEASQHLHLSIPEVAGYRSALVDRFTNPRIRHGLEQIAADGTQKLPVRILPVLFRERAADRVPTGATRVLAAWVCHVRGAGTSVSDPRAAEIVPLAAHSLPDAVRGLVGILDASLAEDADVVAAVIAQAEPICAQAR